MAGIGVCVCDQRCPLFASFSNFANVAPSPRQDSDRSDVSSDEDAASTTEAEEEPQDAMSREVGVSARVNASLYDDNDMCHKLEMTMEQISHMVMSKVRGCEY